MNIDGISCDPKVMVGKPVVTGRRVTVESILERLAAGESEAQIREANPRLMPADIRAAPQFAADVLPGAFTVIRPKSVRIWPGPDT